MRALFQLIGLLAFATCLAMDLIPLKPQEILVPHFTRNEIVADVSPIDMRGTCR